MTVVIGPDSKYMMFWRGEWRAVMNILDASNHFTTNPLRASKAVVYVEPGVWGATLAGPADLIERDDRRTSDREWEMID